MATSTTQDTRRKRAEGREKRRSDAGGRKPSREESGGGRKPSREESGGEQEGGGGGPGTMALVLAGAVAGAVIGTTRALRKRRQTDEGGEDDQGYDEEDEDEDEDEDQPSGRSDDGEGPSNLRNLAVTLLTEALDVLQKDQDTQAEGEDAKPEASDEEDDEPSELDEEDEDEEDEHQRDDRVGRPASRRDNEQAGQNGGGGDAVEVVTQAKRQLAELVGREPESATRVEPADDGWQLSLEVVELDRIPSSTDVLASYDVTLDANGRLVDYARTRRYCRSRPDEAV
jgi:hypothetical protein